MSQCIHCKEDASYHFRVLCVQTLPIRDLSGERRVQALGLFHDFSVCQRCAKAQLEAALHPAKTCVKKILPFGIVLLLGAAMTVLFRSEPPALQLCGYAGIFCGITGLIYTVRTIHTVKQEYSALSPDAALARAAWNCFLTYAPKKDGENDLTYLPVSEETLRLKKDELMLRYDLLPAVAQKAWDLLHRAQEEDSPT